MSAQQETRYLTLAEVLALHDLLMARAGTQASLLDAGKLESAAMRPQMLAYYQEADPLAQAASLIVGIALAHAFSDGNKRLALFAGATFLDVNGLVVEADAIPFGSAIEAVVNRGAIPLEEATERLIAWLRGHTATK